MAPNELGNSVSSSMDGVSELQWGKRSHTGEWIFTVGLWIAAGIIAPMILNVYLEMVMHKFGMKHQQYTDDTQLYVIHLEKVGCNRSLEPGTGDCKGLDGEKEAETKYFPWKNKSATWEYI